MRRSSPARIMIAKPVAQISSAVPRSGSFITNAAGMAISAAGISSQNESLAFLAERPW